jgi:hypothetical protein
MILSEKSKDFKAEVSTLDRGAGQGTSVECNAPVTRLHEVQWHAQASKGSLEAGMEVVKVCALQRQCAVRVTGSETIFMG